VTDEKDVAETFVALNHGARVQEQTRKLVRAIWLAITMLLLGLYFIGQHVAHAQEVQPGHTHDGEVGAFYQSWYLPNHRDLQGYRKGSCCNNIDCHPVNQIKQVGEKWFFFDIPTNQWVLIPATLLEDNQPDPRDSPDGQWHVCNQGSTVFCAVRGSLQ
jgi:hypothetical protein